MKRSSIILILAVILSVSCEKIIDINVPEKDRKIVLNALINPDEVFSIQLSRSKSVLEDNEMAFLNDASVKVFKGEELLGTMNSLDYGRYILGNKFPEVGGQYRIEVNHPVLDPVFSEALIPDPIPILDMDTSRSIDEYHYLTYKLNVSIDDQENTDNYYAISMLLTEKIFDWETESFLDTTQTYNVHFWMKGAGGNNIGGEVMEQQPWFHMDNQLFFHDAPLLGADNRLELALEYHIYSRMGDTVDIELRVDHIDQSYYKYARSKEVFYRTNESPFAEPVKVFNNIDGGFGIFSAFSRSKATYQVITEERR